MTLLQQDQHVIDLEQQKVPDGPETNTRTSLASSSGASFNGYFSPERKWNLKKDGILDARGRRLFESTAMACAADAYPFQAPLDGKTGPMVRTEGREMLMLSS